MACTKFGLAIGCAEAPRILGLTLGAPLTPNCFPMEMLIVVGLERLAAFGGGELPTATAVTSNILVGKREKRTQRSFAIIVQ
jgi:hypothetical protein